MNCFAELYARFPRKMFDVCLEECHAEQRPIFDWELDDEQDARPWSRPCDFCERESTQVWRGTEYDGWDGRYDYPLPHGIDRESHCDDQRCIDMGQFWYDRLEGGKRRSWFYKTSGRRFWDIPKAVKLDTCAAYMLRFEANQVSYGKRSIRKIAA